MQRYEIHCLIADYGRWVSALKFDRVRVINYPLIAVSRIHDHEPSFYIRAPTIFDRLGDLTEHSSYDSWVENPYGAICHEGWKNVRFGLHQNPLRPRGRDSYLWLFRYRSRHNGSSDSSIRNESGGIVSREELVEFANMEPDTLRILWYSRRVHPVEKLKKEEKQVSLIKNVTRLDHFRRSSVYINTNSYFKRKNWNLRYGLQSTNTIQRLNSQLRQNEIPITNNRGVEKFDTGAEADLP